jgi:predicted phage-related endonuclease
VAEPLRIVNYPNREAWLEARRMSIQASDAAGIMGESSWSSAVQLNYLKRGLLPPAVEDEERAQDLDWHRRRENEIADWWWNRLIPSAEGRARIPAGAVIWDPGDYAVAYREVGGLPLGATMDRLILRCPSEQLDGRLRADGLWEFFVPADLIFAPVELKNAHGFMARHWQEEPPIVYLLQCQHQIAVAGTPFGYIAASLGGQPPVWAWMMKDGEILSALLSTYALFWGAVLANEDVSADHREVTSKAIAARYPASDGETVTLGSKFLSKWRTRVGAAATMKQYKALYDEAGNELAQAIGPSSFAKFPDGTIISYKADKRGRRTLRSVSDDSEEAPDNGGFPF